MAAGDILEVTVQANASQTHTSQTLNVEGRRWRLDFYTNKHDGFWYWDLYSAAGDDIIRGCRVVTGLDLFAKYRHLDVPDGVLFVNDLVGPMEDPGLTAWTDKAAQMYYQTAS